MRVLQQSAHTCGKLPTPFRKKDNIYRFQFGIAGRLGTGACVKTDRAEEIVGAETERDREGEMGECVRLRFYGTRVCVIKTNKIDSKLAARTVYKAAHPRIADPDHASRYDPSEVWTLSNAVCIVRFIEKYTCDDLYGNQHISGSPWCQESDIRDASRRIGPLPE